MFPMVTNLFFLYLDTKKPPQRGGFKVHTEGICRWCHSITSYYITTLLLSRQVFPLTLFEKP